MKLRTKFRHMLGALCLIVYPLSAQIGPPPKEGPSKPTPRLADGHPDLGNGKGSWYPRIVDDISGKGGGEKVGARPATMVHRG